MNEHLLENKCLIKNVDYQARSNDQQDMVYAGLIEWLRKNKLNDHKASFRNEYHV